MWAVLGLDGDPLATFGGDLEAWKKAVRFAERNGGELEIVFLTHFRPKEYEPRAA